MHPLLCVEQSVRLVFIAVKQRMMRITLHMHKELTEQ